MGKRKDNGEETSEDHIQSGSPHKKSKHKHKKHKKKRERSSSNSEEIDVVGLDMKKDPSAGFGPLKLKITFGGETVSTAQFIKVPEKGTQKQKTHKVPILEPMSQETADTEDDDDVNEENEFEEIEEVEETIVSQNGDSSQQGVDFEEFGDDLDESVSDDRSQDQPVPDQREDEDEESKWLDALESGDLDDYGRLKKEKDVSLMTARQRALYGHLVEGETELLELPTWAKRRDENTEEAQLRRKQRAKKRKQQMQKQIEESKAQTIEKLLNKQAAKAKKEAKQAAHKLKKLGAHMKYTSGPNGISLSLSKGIEFPLKAQPTRSVPTPVRCAVVGCENAKKYSCSRTMLPVCGLKCYKVVQELHPTPQPVS